VKSLQTHSFMRLFPRYRRLGMATAAHVLEQALPTDLRLSGTAAVIVESLRPLLHAREAEMMDALRPALLAALPVVEPTPSVKVRRTYIHTHIHKPHAIVALAQTRQRCLMRRSPQLPPLHNHTGPWTHVRCPNFTILSYRRC
jgi:hypothetical protein